MIRNSKKHLMKVCAIASGSSLLFRSFLKEIEILPLTALAKTNVAYWCSITLKSVRKVTWKKSLMYLLTQAFKQKVVKEKIVI